MVASLEASTRQTPYGTRSITQDVEDLDNLSTIFELFLKHIEPIMTDRAHPVPLQHKYGSIKDNTKYMKRAVDDGWTVTNYNDVIWEEPGTCSGRSNVTRGQYEDFVNGIRELQNSIADLNKRADELPHICLQQKIEKLEKLKNEMRIRVGEKLYTLFWDTVDKLASLGHPIRDAMKLAKSVHDIIEIAREYGASIDVAREIEQLRKIEKATEHDRLKEWREK